MSGIRSPRRNTLHLFLALLTIATSIDAQEVNGIVYPYDVFREISIREDATAPIVLQNDVIFTYRSDRYVRYVAVAFAHEDFQQLHVFTARSDADTAPADDLLFLVYPVTPDMRELRYRLVVDGVWMADPNGVETVYDERGIPISRVALMERPISEFTSPFIRPDGAVEFRFAYDFQVANEVGTLSGRSIAIYDVPRQVPMVVGTFNGWDPFMDRMRPHPDNPDLYSVVMNLPPGDYYYYYLIGGERILDPTNPRLGYDPQIDATVSRLVVPAGNE